jgi:hypothetical protein
MSAGSSWDSYVSGRYFRVIDAAKPLDIDFFSRGNQKGTANDVGVGFWIKPTASFDRIIVRSAEAQTVTIMVGAGEAGYDRMSVTGTVSVVDGERYRVNDGGAYVAAVEYPASAGFMPMAGIYSGTRDIIVRRLIIGSGNTQSFTFAAAAVYEVSAFANLTTPGKKLTGGPVASATFKHQQSAVAPVTLLSPCVVMTGIGPSLVLPLPEPYVVPVGYAFCVASKVSNVSASIIIEFDEEVP